jgi:hypothetical protein
VAVSAQEVGQLASLLRFGLYAHDAALEIARDPRRSPDALTEVGQSLAGNVLCKDKTERTYDLAFVLDQIRSNPILSAEATRRGASAL